MADAATLAGLRAEIDRIDAEMHRLLIDRSAVIDRLVATKGTAASGSAFRPDREAAMMRALADRHAGRLPLEAVEGIWRVIISTFTHLQAPFRVHGDASASPDAMRDSARFHFGFTVPYLGQAGPREVIAAVAASRGDLGLLSLDVPEATEPWWRALEPPDAPKVIARLPFLDRPDHPAGLPVLAITPAPDAAAAGAVRLLSVLVPDGAEPPRSPGIERLARCGPATLVADRQAEPVGDQSQRLARLGWPVVSAVPVGGHAAPYAVG